MGRLLGSMISIMRSRLRTLRMGRGRVLGPSDDEHGHRIAANPLPYSGSEEDIRRQTADPDSHPIPPGEIVADIPADLESVVLKALSKNPTDRYPESAQFAVDLQRVLKGTAVSAPGRKRPITVPRCPSCRHKLKRGQTRCPSCGVSNVAKKAGVRSEVVPEDDDSASPELPEGWSDVPPRASARGVSLIITRITLMFCTLGLLLLAVVLFWIPLGPRGWVRYLPIRTAGVALALIPVGQVLELIGLALLLKLPAVSRCRRWAIVAMTCQVLAITCGGLTYHFITDFALDLPIASSLGSRPSRPAPPTYPTYPKSKTPVTKPFEVPEPKASELFSIPYTPRWLIFSVSAMFFVLAGWVASVITTGRLNRYVQGKRAANWITPTLVLGMVTAFGPILLLIIGIPIFSLTTWLWYALIVVLIGLVMFVFTLLAWRSGLSDLRAAFHQLTAP